MRLRDAEGVLPGADVATLMTRARDRGSVPVIVQLALSWRPEADLPAGVAAAQTQALRVAQASVLTALGVTDLAAAAAGKAEADGVLNVKVYDYSPLLAMRVDAARLDILMGLPEVARIQEDEAVPPALKDSVPLIGGTAAHTADYTGSGWHVAILDTGVNKNHEFLLGDVVSEACYSSNGTGFSSLCPGGVTESTASGSGLDCENAAGCGHGTHVGGIVAGNAITGTAGTIRGVAPGAKLIAIQVFTKFHSPDQVLAFTSDIIKGLERVYALRTTYNISSVNMSLGGGQFFSACDTDSRKPIIDNLAAAGIATVIASGNNGWDGSVGAPGCISTAVTVGSTTKADVLSSFSNHATMVDLLAPGSSIQASYGASATVGTTQCNNCYSFLNGTSMATPHVAGAWAIMKQLKPTGTVSEILAAFQATGVDVSRAGITKKRINVNDARGQVGTVPGAATLVSPSGTISAASPTFTWNRVTGATWYYLWVDTAAGVNAIKEWVTDADVCSGTTCSVSRPLAVGSYKWWIQTWNSSGYGPWSSSLSFDRVCSGTTTAMTSPTPSSTLTGTSVTFSWAGNPCATSFYLYVGTTPGGFNLYNASTGLTQSALVTGLPKDGSTVYVRLWTLADAAWTYVDYSYTAYTADLGRLKSPVNGSLLTGTSTTLEWLPGSGVTQYWLSVGTTQGGSSIFGGSVGTQLSTTITGIPTATCTAVPAFTSPLAGSVLSGSSVAFSWSAPCTGPTIHVRLWSLAGGVWDYIDYALETTGYRFRLGRGPGRSDLHHGSQGTGNVSPTISSLPTNGAAVFASLSYLDGGVWKDTAASFTAAGSTQGFTEEFSTSGTPADWHAVSGDWLVGSYYLSYGIPSNGASVSHSSTYTTLDYSATVKRDEAGSGSANRLWVRGDTSPIAETNWWQSAYAFQYSNYGTFSVYKIVNGKSIPVQDWTSSGAIVQGANWNTLRVRASGSSMSFYINGTLVWTGSDPSLSRGRVGVGFYGSAAFYIDRATLSTTLLAGDERLSPEQEALNRAAQQNGSAGDINQAPPTGR